MTSICIETASGVSSTATIGPGPAFNADEWRPWDRKSYKFGPPKKDGAGGFFQRLVHLLKVHGCFFAFVQTCKPGFVCCIICHCAGPPKVGGPYYNFPNDTIAGNKPLGGWRPPHSGSQSEIPAAPYLRMHFNRSFGLPHPDSAPLP